MRLGIDTIVIVNRKDKTDSIVSCNFRGGKCDIVYNSASMRFANMRKKSLRRLKVCSDAVVG